MFKAMMTSCAFIGLAAGAWVSEAAALECRAEAKSATFVTGKDPAIIVVEVRRPDAGRIVTGGGCGVSELAEGPPRPPRPSPPLPKPHLSASTVINEPPDQRTAIPVGWRCEWYVPRHTPRSSATASVIACAP